MKDMELGGPLSILLDSLADEEAPLRAGLLYRLSEPVPDDLAELQARWPLLPVERRRLLLLRMTEASETNFDLDFSAVARFALSDDDSEVRQHAIAALWTSEDPAVLRGLVRLLQIDESADVRAAAAQALGRFVLACELGELPSTLAETVETALLEAWYDDMDATEVRRRALESIAYSGREEVSSLIEEAAAHPDLKMRSSALFAMGRSSDERWAPYVLSALNVAEPELRFEAARAAGELGLVDAVPRLIELLQDPDHELMEAAIWSLGEIGGPDATNALVKLLRRNGLNEHLVDAVEDALATAALIDGQFGLFSFFGDDQDVDIGDDWANR
jgi:HEAT repeat protein